MSESPSRGIKRKKFDIAFKLAAVNRVKAGERQCVVAKELGLNEATLRGWIRTENELTSASIQMSAGIGLAKKQMRKAADDNLDQALFQWFSQKTSEGRPISGPVLAAQAKVLDIKLNGEESKFEASNGWLHRFKTRHGISQARMNGEVRSADMEAAETYPRQLRQTITDGRYKPEQVYNCDETGLCYKMLPDTSLSLKSDPHRREGFKTKKDRVTILFAVNRTGSHKVKPLIIGKSKNPRTLHHVNRTTLPMKYDNSNKAWMTAKVFEDWFFKLFHGLEEKALLLLDNCPAHPPADKLLTRDGKIRVEYLPKNTTSKIQPLDQGIIANFKVNYKREIRLTIAHSELPIEEELRTLNIKEVIYLSAKTWDAVTPTCISKCWTHGLGGAFVLDEPDEEFDGFSADDVTEAERNLVYVTDNEIETFQTTLKGYSNRKYGTGSPVTTTARPTMTYPTTR